MSRYARCLPVPAASRPSPTLGAPLRPLTRPVEAHHAACSLRSTFSHPARPSSQASIRRGFWRLGADGGCRVRGSAGSGWCGDSWAADGPVARVFRSFWGQRRVFKHWGCCLRGAQRPTAFDVYGLPVALWPRARAQPGSIAVVCLGGVVRRVQRRERGVYVPLPAVTC